MAIHRLKAGYTLYGVVLLLLVLTIAAAALLVTLKVRTEQRNLAEALSREEAALSSRQVFEHLYGLMRKGWSAEDIDEALKRLRSARPDMDIRLIRAPAVIRQFGPRPSDPAPGDEALVKQAIASGEAGFAAEGGRERYVMPLVASAECQSCHRVRIGEVNGAIDLSFRAERFSKPLDDAIAKTVTALAVVFGGLIAVTLALVRALVIRPLATLAANMEAVVEDQRYDRKIPLPRAVSHELQRLARAFDTLLADADRSQKRLRENSMHDPLTGAYNRRYLMQMLDELGEAERPGGAPYAVCLVDLDRFKPINDNFGHAAGDRVLEAVVAAMGQAIREADILARVGGDEFVIVAPELDREEALARRVQEAVEAVAVRWGAESLGVGASVGLSWSGDAADRRGEAMLARADAAMYAQKRSRAARLLAPTSS